MRTSFTQVCFLHTNECSFLNKTESFLFHLYSLQENQRKNYLAASTHTTEVRSRKYIKSSREGDSINFNGATMPHEAPVSKLCLRTCHLCMLNLGSLFCFKVTTTFIQRVSVLCSSLTQGQEDRFKF